MKYRQAICWAGLSVGAGWVNGQTAGAPAGAVRIVVEPRVRERAIKFVNAKPIVGLPEDAGKAPAHCSNDGLSYFDLAADTRGGARTLGLVSVSTTGEVKRVERTVPVDFTSVVEKDFFAGEQELVTLVEAGQRDDRDPLGPPRGVRYFLSISDHGGDGGKVLELDLRFKPLKVGAFGSGEYLVLGWDEANLLPVLAVLKNDGTVRRFVDFEERTAASGKSGEETPVARYGAGTTAAMLQDAVLVPFGLDVLLTYPGTAKPIRVVRDGHESRMVALKFPTGFVLKDVLVSGGDWLMVARLQPSPDPDKKSTDKPLRIFEFNRQDGSRVQEYLFEGDKARAVTCAAKQSLIAVYPEALGGKEAGTQMVVSSVRR